MSLWRQITRGLRTLVDSRTVDAESNDEIQDYVERATAALIADGHSPDDARRRATMQFGNSVYARESLRISGWENAVAILGADIKYALRRLRSSPAFTIVSVLTLALGIGASTAIFSAVNPILFQPLPYPHAERIVSISDIGAEGGPLDVTFGTFLELSRRNHSFDALAVWKAWHPTMMGDAEPEQLDGLLVSANYFRTLGVAPKLGRDFQADDDRPGAPPAAIVSDALWHRRLGADPSIVGRTVKLDGQNILIIGVMPAAFDDVVAPRARLWGPLQYTTALTAEGREWGHHLKMLGRVRSNVPLDQAHRDLDNIARNPVADFARVPWATLRNGLIVQSLQTDITRDVRPALLATLGAVLLVLAIACVNVTNLLLARGVQRRGEFAVRIALGAGRGRLVRQVITESVILALIGGICAVAVGELGVRAIIALTPPDLPRVNAIRIDGVVFTFTLLITTIVGLGMGVAPALYASHGDPRDGLQDGSRRTAGGHERTRKALVVAEVAFALTLLVGAGLLLRSLTRLLSTPVGFEPAHVVSMQVQEVGTRFQSDSDRYRFFARALDKVQHVPGVATAAFTSQLPLSGQIDGYGIHFETDLQTQGGESGLRYAVTPDYFGAMRIPLRSGRLLDAHDVDGSPRVALLSESFAKRKFPRGDALGQRVRLGPDDGQWYTVVGVVGDVKQTSLALANPDAFYVSPTQWHWVDNTMSLVVRTRTEATALIPALRTAIWSVDKDQPILRVATMEQLVTRSEANRHFALVLFEAFGVVALLLAAIGIYGVLSGSVTERIREIGVRSALGASPGDILALVLRQGLSLTFVGVVLGLAGAVAATRALSTMLFGISRVDPITYVAVTALLFGVSAIACWLPAMRAASVDPSRTLRSE
ncbi:MAG TPA: ABC transporter permease [Gemmatimonadaceae bacterium]|jgi:predicted permease